GARCSAIAARSAWNGSRSSRRTFLPTSSRGARSAENETIRARQHDDSQTGSAARPTGEPSPLGRPYCPARSGAALLSGQVRILFAWLLLASETAEAQSDRGEGQGPEDPKLHRCPE